MRIEPIRRSAVRPPLVLGGDRELVLWAGFAAFMAVVLGRSLDACLMAAVLWFGGLHGLRRLAKYDPLIRPIYLRHRNYRAYYPARAHVLAKDELSHGARR